MRLFRKKQPTEEELRRREERNQRYFEYGQRLSQRLRYHERLEKANEWANNNTRKLAVYSFFGVILMYVPFVLHGIYMSHHKQDTILTDNPLTNVSVEGNMRIAESQIGLQNKIKELAREGNEYVAAFDSLVKIENKTHEDSVRMMETYEKIRKINSILETK